MNTETKRNLLAAFLVFLVVAFRVIEHPFNATPLVAVMLFSAVVFKEMSWKILVPLSALLISDFAIELKNGYGFHSSTLMVYSTFALIFVMAFFLMKKVNVLSVLLSSTLGSVVFFLVTNFAFFYPVAAIPNPALGHYPHNLTGIIASYQAGIPFFRNMFVGDLMFTSLLFGSFYLISQSKWFSNKSLA